MLRPPVSLLALLLIAGSPLPASADGRFGQSYSMPAGDYDKRWHCVHRGQIYSAGAVVQMDGMTLRCTSSEQIGFGDSFRYATWVPVQPQEEGLEPPPEIMTKEQLQQQLQEMRALLQEVHQLNQKINTAAPTPNR